MDDIIIYNDVKSEILRRLREMYRWNSADIALADRTHSDIEKGQKQNAYIEYIASHLVDLPMPD